MENNYSLNYKRSVVHGISPNPKKDFTKLRENLKNSENEMFQETVLTKNIEFSLNDSFDFSTFDCVGNYVENSAKSSTSDENEKIEFFNKIPTSDVFVKDLKHVDLTVRSVCRRQDEVVLLAENSTSSEFTVVLRGFWVQSIVNVGDKIRVFILSTNSAEKSRFVIENDENFILIKPDQILTSTGVSSACFCRRKAVLNEKFQGSESSNKAMLVGTLVHELFQKAIVENIFQPGDLKILAEKILFDIKILEQLYFLDLTVNDIWDELNVYIPQLSHLISTKFQHGSRLFDEPNEPRLFFDKIHDIEENIWMPKYGVRGKVDLTLEVFDEKAKRKIVPLELKTGRTTTSAEHKAQVSLYLVMLSELYPNTSKNGALLYLKESKMKRIELRRKELHGIVQMRNHVAHCIEEFASSSDRFSLPEPLKSANICSKCPQLLPCSMFTRLESFNDDEENSGWNNFMLETLRHLSNVDYAYFKQWVYWICSNATEKSKHKRLTDIWTVPAVEREKRREALCNLQVVKNSIDNKFQITLCRAKFHQLSCHFLPMDVFDIGQYAVLSNETSRHIATAAGTVVHVDNTIIKLKVEQELVYKEDDVFRLDHYNSSTSALRTSLGTLARLFECTNSKLRNLIVHNHAPTFNEKISPSTISPIKHILKRLNKHQILLVLKVFHGLLTCFVLRAEDYVLVKSFDKEFATLLASLVEVLTTLNRSVLLAAFANAALDSVLIELAKTQKNILRLGAESQVDVGCKQFLLKNLLRDDDMNLERLKNIYNKTPVAATCSTIGSHGLFVKRRFDFVIIVDANASADVNCLAPLLCADKFVLVNNRSAVDVRNDERLKPKQSSLFVSLEGNHTAAVVNVDEGRC